MSFSPYNVPQHTQVNVLWSKLHRVTVTATELGYEGSLTVDRDLMDAAQLQPYQAISVYNINNGQRFDTYVIEGERGTGTIQVNGAAARMAERGDLIIVAAFASIPQEALAGWQPTVVLVDNKNTPLSTEARVLAGV